MTPPTTVTLPTPRGLRVVGWVMLALETSGVAWLVAEVRDVGLLVSSTVPMLVGAAIAVGLLVCTLRVQVDARLATFSFLPFFRRSVCWCEIDDVVVRDRVSPAEVGGLGLRRAPGGRRRCCGVRGPASRCGCATAGGSSSSPTRRPDCTIGWPRCPAETRAGAARVLAGVRPCPRDTCTSCGARGRAPDPDAEQAVDTVIKPSDAR